MERCAYNSTCYKREGNSTLSVPARKGEKKGE